MSSAALVVALLASTPPSWAIDKNQFYQQVRQQLDNGQVSEQSMAQLQEIVQNEPNDSNGHLLLGLVLDSLGLNEEAAAQFELAVRYGANNSEALVKLCKQQIKVGRVPAAMALMNEGAKKFPNNAEMLYLIGDYLLQEKRGDDARTVLSKAVEINPNIFGLPTSLGAALLEINPMRSSKLASMDLEKQPNYERGHHVRGLAYKYMGVYDKAAKDLQIIFDRLPIFVPVADALTDCYYMLGDYDKALKPAVFLVAFTSFPEVEHSGNVPKLVRVMKKMDREKIVPAVAVFEKQISDKYVKPEFNYCLGKAYDEIDMPYAAMDQYKRCLQKSPKYVKALFRLAVDQETVMRDYKEALSNYQAAYTMRPWDHEIALAYMRLQDRLQNQKGDLAWKWKDWINKNIFNVK